MEAIHKQGQSKKAMASLVMLISWKIWTERNARVFWNVFSTSTMTVNKIKDDVALWSAAVTKTVYNIMPRE
jgi:hypothetical protein